GHLGLEGHVERAYAVAEVEHRCFVPDRIRVRRAPPRPRPTLRNMSTAADPSPESAILVEGLTKTFGPTRALDGLDLTVATVEVHGFLGPNGSGKSTTLRILLGLLRADSGTVRLLGGDPWRDTATLHRRLAYVPGDVSLWPNLSG